MIFFLIRRYLPQPAHPAQFPPQLHPPEADEGFAPIDHLPSYTRETVPPHLGQTAWVLREIEVNNSKRCPHLSHLKS